MDRRPIQDVAAKLIFELAPPGEFKTSEQDDENRIDAYPARRRPRLRTAPRRVASTRWKSNRPKSQESSQCGPARSPSEAGSTRFQNTCRAHPPEDRAATSGELAYNPATKEKQNLSDQFEAKAAKALGLDRTDDNRPMDHLSEDGKVGVQ